ncbi:hypothetical protein [Natrinema zhouii]|nr:hypothetical protein [Natrinema zhouii]
MELKWQKSVSNRRRSGRASVTERSVAVLEPRAETDASVVGLEFD